MINEIKNEIDPLIRNYPSGSKVITSLISSNFEICDKKICIGNGASELINSLARYITGKVGIILPTFEEYPNSFDEVVFYTPKNKLFKYDEKDIINYFSNKDISTLFVINPDNPSGNYLQREGIISLLNWSLEMNIRLIIDESFLDFSDDGFESSLIKSDVLNKYPLLVVIKSISKSYGIPGLRLGFIASADYNLISYIKKDVAIWNINSIAEFFLQIIDEHKAEYIHSCAKLRKERDDFFDKLSSLSFLRIIPSQSNYFLCYILFGNITSTKLAEILSSKYNILIKDCSAKMGVDSKKYFRIAIKKNKDNNFLFNALSEIKKDYLT